LQRPGAGLSPYSQDWLEDLAPIYGCKPHDLISRHPKGARAVQDDIFLAYVDAPIEVQRQVDAANRALLGLR
jgi:hypothetical protein